MNDSSDSYNNKDQVKSVESSKPDSLLHRIYKHCDIKIHQNVSCRSNKIYVGNINKRQQLKRYRNGNGEQ